MKRKLDPHRWTRIVLSIIQIAALSLLGSSAPLPSKQTSTPPPLFEELALVDSALSHDLPAYYIRSRYVSVNLGHLLNSGGDASASPGVAELTLNLFPDVGVTAMVESIKSDPWLGTSWSGSILENQDGYFYIVVRDGIFIAHVASEQGIFEVSWAAEGVYRVVQIDQSNLGEDYPEEDIPTGEVAAANALGDSADSGATIDVMVIYTAAARIGEGSTAAMLARIALAMTETNDSYANAGVTPRLNLVHTAEVDYAESGNISTDLSRFRGTSDGYMDNIHSLRDTYKADMVALIVENGGGYCGVASAILATASTAFQVTKRSGCMTGYYTFGHEFGHLQGARHDVYVDPTTTPFAYGHGFVHLHATENPQRWRTVMAYNNKCADSGYSCTRLKWWSNPSVNYLGAGMGDNDSKNYLVLNETAQTVANFRTATLPKPTPVSPSGKISDSTPTYNWTPVAGASKYNYQVRRSSDNSLVYTYTVNASTCSAEQCQHTPSPVLAFEAHKWRVRAYIDGSWRPFSAFKSFTVVGGFDSSFNGSMDGWKVVNGVWGIQNSAFLRTFGRLDKRNSVYYDQGFTSLVYTAKLRRFGTGCEGCANALVIRGTPLPTWSPSQHWKTSYYFQFTNNGYYSVWRMDNGSSPALQDWTTTAAIKPGMWNVLKVVANGSTLKFYINGTLVWTGSDATYPQGYVGISMYRDLTSTGNRLLVDWAKLSTFAPADELVQETVEPGQVVLEGGSPEMSPVP